MRQLVRDVAVQLRVMIMNSTGHHSEVAERARPLLSSLKSNERDSLIHELTRQLPLDVISIQQASNGFAVLSLWGSEYDDTEEEFAVLAALEPWEAIVLCHIHSSHLPFQTALLGLTAWWIPAKPSFCNKIMTKCFANATKAMKVDHTGPFHDGLAVKVLTAFAEAQPKLFMEALLPFASVKHEGRHGAQHLLLHLLTRSHKIAALLCETKLWLAIQALAKVELDTEALLVCIQVVVSVLTCVPLQAVTHVQSFLKIFIRSVSVVASSEDATTAGQAGDLFEASADLFRLLYGIMPSNLFMSIRQGVKETPALMHPLEPMLASVHASIGLLHSPVDELKLASESRVDAEAVANVVCPLRFRYSNLAEVGDSASADESLELAAVDRKLLTHHDNLMMLLARPYLPRMLTSESRDLPGLVSDRDRIVAAARRTFTAECGLLREQFCSKRVSSRLRSVKQRLSGMHALGAELDAMKVVMAREREDFKELRSALELLRAESASQLAVPLEWRVEDRKTINSLESQCQSLGEQVKAAAMMNCKNLDEIKSLKTQLAQSRGAGLAMQSAVVDQLRRECEMARSEADALRKELLLWEEYETVHVQQWMMESQGHWEDQLRSLGARLAQAEQRLEESQRSCEKLRGDTDSSRVSSEALVQSRLEVNALRDLLESQRVSFHSQLQEVEKKYMGMKQVNLSLEAALIDMAFADHLPSLAR